MDKQNNNNPDAVRKKPASSDPPQSIPQPTVQPHPGHTKELTADGNQPSQQNQTIPEPTLQTNNILKFSANRLNTDHQNAPGSPDTDDGDNPQKVNLAA